VRGGNPSYFYALECIKIHEHLFGKKMLSIAQGCFFRFLALARRDRAPRREFYFLPVLAKILRFCGKIAKKPGFPKL
jgi:hypothetical protein